MKEGTAAIGQGPHLWLLTGLIELEDVTRVSKDEHGPSFGTGVDPATVLVASGGVDPVGGSGDGDLRITGGISRDSKADTSLTMNL